jgi:hypothetical protein
MTLRAIDPVWGVAIPVIRSRSKDALCISCQNQWKMTVYHR